MRCSLLLSYNFASIELDQHGAICLEFLYRNGETEVVEDEELKLEVVELDQGEASDLRLFNTCTDSKHGRAYLGISGVRVEDVREEFARTGDACNDQTMNVVAIHHEKLRQIVRTSLRRRGWRHLLICSAVGRRHTT